MVGGCCCSWTNITLLNAYSSSSSCSIHLPGVMPGAVMSDRLTLNAWFAMYCVSQKKKKITENEKKKKKKVYITVKFCFNMNINE
jgi:hypothetical protein